MRGGARPGSGRKPLPGHEKLTTYEKGLSLLNENITNAVDTVIKLMNSECEHVRLKAAALLMKKVYPDQQNIHGDITQHLTQNKRVVTFKHEYK